LTQAELVCCAVPVLNTALLATRVEQGRKREEGVSSAVNIRNNWSTL